MANLTIYEIAKLAGVSITTVSRVLNGQDNVNGQTREKVERIIQKYNYIPRQKARNFTQEKAYTVGLLMDDIRHPYMSEMAYAVIQYMASWKVNSIICNLTDVEKEFMNEMDNLIEKKVGGVFLMGSIFENEICRTSIERRYSDFHFVSVNANFALPNICQVMQDHIQGIENAVTYLREQCGRTRIGYIFRCRSHSDRNKYQGYRNGIRKGGAEIERVCMVRELSHEAGQGATEALLSRYPDTDALIYSSDLLAVGGVHYLNDTGIRIPEQIAVVGFNNSQCARDCYPQITSIDNCIADAGKRAAHMMMEILNGQLRESRVERLECKLALRRSTEGKKERKDSDETSKYYFPDSGSDAAEGNL